jgi:hypothetical protein
MVTANPAGTGEEIARLCSVSGENLQERIYARCDKGGRILGITGEYES